MEESEDLLREIAELKLELEKASSAQTRFLANISHEIRTPLGGITGYADQLLFDSSLSPQHREKVISIKRCANHLTSLISDILDLSKMEAGKNQVQCAEFNFLNLLHEISSVIQARSHDKGLKFEILFDSPIPECVFSDPLRLRQILINLLGNAVKFTDKGSITLRVAAHNFLENMTGTIVLTISDSGCGIPLDSRESVFQRFSAANHSFNRQSSGSGLGLYLSKNLAQQLGGDLTLIESIPGKGSTFECSFAAQLTDKARFVQEFIPNSSFRDVASDIKSFEGKLSGIKVLLVEDGLDNQRIFTYFLRLGGAEVVLEKDGAQALQRIWQDKGFDIILMDIQLPVMDGYTVTEELRRQGYTQPIIAVTAHALAEERARCLECGFSDYLSKPVDIERLMRTVMRYTGRDLSPNVLLKPDSSGEGGEREAAPREDSARGNLARGGAIFSKYHKQALYRPMIQEFVRGLDERLAESGSCIEQKKWDQLSRLMHQLKGAAATYGYAVLSDAAGSLESSVRQLERDPHETLMPRISEGMHGLLDLCQRMKAGLEQGPGI